MASLQRSKVSFRSQGSSGLVWEDKYLLEEDGTVALHHHLRPSQSTRERLTTGSEPSTGAFSRSLSTPNKKRSSSLLHDLFRQKKCNAEESSYKPPLPTAAPMSKSRD